MKRWLGMGTTQLAAAGALLLLLLEVGSAEARPGGGQSYSGSRHHGGGGGGGGGGGDGFAGELIFLLIRMIFFYPQIGIPLVLIVLFVFWRMRHRGFDSWDTTATASNYEPVATYRDHAPASPQRTLDALFEVDPDFSAIVFEDFAYRLYASAWRAHTQTKELDGLAPYLADDVRAGLAKEEPEGVAATQVIVGSMRVESVDVPAANDAGQQVSLTLLYESNVTLGSAHEERTFYLRESWQLRRDKSARTRPPEQTERLGCPNCGAPFESSDNARCNYCNQVVSGGRFAWQVVQRQVLSRELRPPALTSDVEEVGTDEPSVIAPDEQAAWSALSARDPSLNDADIRARLSLIFSKLNEAYSALDLMPVRGFLSDGMFDYLRYWTDAYRAQGLRNVLEGTHIVRAQRVKVQSDRYFDAITFRIWASGLDFTIDVRSNRRISGSAQEPRDYSEYWTLIRAAGVRGQSQSEANCPNCAAPLKVTMAGTCSYCSAHITRGEFDWVLSKIEQDEAYEG